MLGDIKEDYGNQATIPVIGLLEQNFQTKAGMFNHTELPLVCVCVCVARVTVPGRNFRIKCPLAF